MSNDNSICNYCDHLKESEGENSWENSTGCYKLKTPVGNECDEREDRDLTKLMGGK